MRSTKHIQVTVSTELANWFDENFSFATKQGFLEQCLLHLRAAVVSGALPIPNVYAAHSAIGAINTITETEAKRDGSHQVRSQTEET